MAKKHHLGFYGRLNHHRIREVNQDLISYYFHPAGGKRIAGALMAEIYEIRHGISFHGYESSKIYELHIKKNKKGEFNVLVSEAPQFQTVQSGMGV